MPRTLGAVGPGVRLHFGAKGALAAAPAAFGKKRGRGRSGKIKKLEKRAKAGDGPAGLFLVRFLLLLFFPGANDAQLDDRPRFGAIR
jgi:hypothetical protein